MEKMRRARINDSLNELKSLILEALNKDVSVRKQRWYFYKVFKSQPAFQIALRIFTYNCVRILLVGFEIFEDGESGRLRNDRSVFTGT